MIPKGTPDRIYLQLGPEKVERGDKFSDYGEVTWCEDKIDDYDIEYIRADRVAQLEHGYDVLRTALHKAESALAKVTARPEQRSTKGA